MKRFYLTAITTFTLTSGVFALPEGAQVNLGDAAISQPDANTMLVQQNTDKVVINFEEYNIDSQELVQYIQPGQDSIALNRVLGANPSQIFGRISANGQVFLINPNGIMFAPGAQVDVGGLLATTLDITDDDFANSNLSFAQHQNDSGIINQGELTAIPEGYIALVATTVTNSGSITADHGRIAMVSADSVRLHIAGSELAIETDESSWQGLVDNQGVLQANGGLVLMDARTQGSLYETVINNEGEIRANQLENRDGEVWLVAKDQGDIWQQGTIDVSATQNAGDGGTVHIEGERIAQTGTIKANAVGNGDGGLVEMLANDTLVLTDGSSVEANAGTHGEGGAIHAVSQQTAILRKGATLEAKGGTEQGDGGFVDVSGFWQVEVAGTADVSAANGATGTFLIDPFDITIANADVNGAFDGGNPNTWSATASGSTIDTATITTNLATANVVIQTAGAGAEPGNITVNSAIDLDGSNGNTLTLQADTDININADILDQNTATIDDTNIVLTASGVINVTDGNVVDAGGGTLALTATAGMNISGLRTTNNSATAVTLVSNGVITGNSAGATTEIFAPNGGVSINAISDINAMNTEVSSIDLANNAGNFNFTEIDDVTITGGANLNLLNLTAGGTVSLPAAYTMPGNLIIDAFDLNATDIAATDFTLNLTGGTGDLALNLNVDRVDMSVLNRNLTLNETNGLSVLDLNGDTSALNVENGNLTVNVQSGALVINDNVNASDTLANGTRTGLIDIAVNGGNLNIGSTGATQIISTNTVDQGATGGLAGTASDQVAIRIQQTNTLDQTADFTFGDGVGNDVLVQANGGDLFIDSVGGATLTGGNTRNLTINSDATFDAFNTALDPKDGSVVLGDNVINQGVVVAGTGRAILLNETLSDTVNPDIDDSIADSIDPEVTANETDADTDIPNWRLDQLFTDVFGDCREENTRYREQRCRSDDAIKRFLSSLLLGGELP